MESLRITVFDLSPEDCGHTAGTLREYFMVRGLSAGLTEFSEIQPFVMDYMKRYESGEPYDMAFVGVDSMIGAEAARHIREIDDRLPLFLVSRVSDFGLEGFRLRALDYLTKPVSTQTVGEAIARVTAPCFGGLRKPELLL